MNGQQMPVKVDRNLEKVLKVFQEYGNVTTGFLVDETGLSRPTVTKRLDRLHAADCIEYLHEPTALWRLKRDPRDENLNE
jgi:Mn-dependent DtxR family transcriptional regulator